MNLLDILEELGFSYYNYDPKLSDFRYIGWEDGDSIVEVNEVGKTCKRLKITISVEEVTNE